jgi:glycosyltransferase involved in cell wall biosynthesis
VSLSLSVVVCTHNRALDLAQCLDALCQLHEAPEIIVVDSASEPPIRNLVESYTDRLSGLRHVREDRAGLSRARNRGVAEARGDVIAFLDDDAAPHPDWAGKIVAPFEADAGVGCVGGACLAEFDGVARPRWLSDRLLQFAGITRFGPDAREPRSSAEWPFGANIAFRAAALDTVEGPFSEQLGRDGTTLLSGEESALVHGLLVAGWKVWLEPGAAVGHTVHPERCRSRYYWRRLWWAGVSRARAADVPWGLGLRLVVAAATRFVLYAVTRDRVHLYRTAETAGFLVERVRLLRSST